MYVLLNILRVYTFQVYCQACIQDWAILPAVPDKPPPPWPVLRDKTFNVRIEPELYDAAVEKADALGVAAIVRAFLRAYVRGAVEPPSEDLAKELQWAPRRRKPRKGRAGK